MGLSPTRSTVRKQEREDRFDVWQEMGTSIRVRDGPLKPSFRFDLLSFQPRLNKVLSGGFSYIFQDLWKLPRLFSPDPNTCPHNLEPLLQL